MTNHYIIKNKIQVNHPVQLFAAANSNTKYGTIVPLTKTAVMALEKQIAKLTPTDLQIDESSQLAFAGEQIPQVFLNQDSQITIRADNKIVNATFTNTVLDTKDFAGCIIKNSKLTDIKTASNLQNNLLALIDSDLAHLELTGNCEIVKSAIIFEGKDAEHDLLKLQDAVIDNSSLLPVNVKVAKTDTSVCHLNNCYLTNVVTDSTIEFDNVILQSFVKQQLVPVFKSWKISNFTFILNDKITADQTIGNLTLKLFVKDKTNKFKDNLTDELIILKDANNTWD